MDLGNAIRSRRIESGLTLEALAERTGVSRAMLSDIERNVKNPTLKVVCQIVEGLGCTVSQLLGEDIEPSEKITTTRQHERQVLIDPRSGVERHLLSPAFLRRGIEILYYVIPAGQRTDAFPAHQPGVKEHITVVQGQMHCHLGSQEVHLNEGDSISFDADIPHDFSNPQTEPCTYFLVIDSSNKRS